METMDATTLEPFVSMKEVCKHLSVSEAYIYQNQSALNIPRYKIGKHWKYRLSEIDQWVLSQQVK